MTLGLIDLVPPTGIGLGPLFLGFYGLGYVLAIAVMIVVTRSEARRRGLDPALVTNAILLVAVCALVGARLYHVVGEWSLYQDDPIRVVLPPYSGLGLFGGIAGATVGIAIHVRRHAIPLWRALDVVVPGTLLAQGIARWGNYFNQELYGPPTDLPIGITIDCAHRLQQYPCASLPAATTGFHPLFLYESILDLCGGLVALVLARRGSDRLRDGDLASFWAIWYGSTRLLLETFRAGWNWTVGGIPTAMLVGAGLVLAGILTIAVRHARPTPTDPTPTEPTTTALGEA